MGQLAGESAAQSESLLAQATDFDKKRHDFRTVDSPEPTAHRQPLSREGIQGA